MKATFSRHTCFHVGFVIKGYLFILIIQRHACVCKKIDTSTKKNLYSTSYKVPKGNESFAIAIITLNERVTFQLEAIFFSSVENYFLSKCLGRKKNTLIIFSSHIWYNFLPPPKRKILF